MIIEACTAYGLVQATFRDRLFATIAHDLRNPLHSAQTAAALIASRPQANQVTEWAGRIIENIGRVDRMVRDVLVAEIPVVLRADLYALAALAGAAVVVTGSLLDLPSSASTIAGAALCFGLRLMAILRGWHLPVARAREHAETPRATAPPDE